MRTQLRSYLDNGRYEIDNNTAENAIQPIAQGRANWLFFGSDNGALSGAIHMTFAAMSKLHGIDLYTAAEREAARDPGSRPHSANLKETEGCVSRYGVS